MPTPSEIKIQQQLLVKHRERLYTFLGQVATNGESFAPPGQISGIGQARAEIAQIKVWLRDQNIEVEDLPGELAGDDLLDYRALMPRMARRSKITEVIWIAAGLLIVGLIILGAAKWLPKDWLVVPSTASSSAPTPTPEPRLMYTDRPNTSLDEVDFYWDPIAWNGTIFVVVCTRQASYWVTSQELHPNPQIWGLFPRPGVNGCAKFFPAAMGVLAGDVMEIGVGAGSTEPQKSGKGIPFAQLPGTRFYKVERVDEHEQVLKVTLLREIPPP